MEREREEHLQPRLHLQEIKQPALPKASSPPDSDSSDVEPIQEHEHAPSHTPPRQQEDGETSQLRIRQQHGNIGAPLQPQQLPPPGPLPPQQVQALSEHKPSPSLSTSPVSTDSRISAPGELLWVTWTQYLKQVISKAIFSSSEQK